MVYPILISFQFMKYFEATKWTLVSFVTFEPKHIGFIPDIKPQIWDGIHWTQFQELCCKYFNHVHPFATFQTIGYLSSLELKSENQIILHPLKWRKEKLSFVLTEYRTETYTCQTEFDSVKVYQSLNENKNGMSKFQLNIFFVR